MLDYQECILKLRKQEKKVEADSLSVVVKHVPESAEAGMLDPRQVKWTEQCRKTPSSPVKDLRHATMEEITSVRNSMGCKNSDLSQNVTVEESVFDAVAVEVYRRRNLPAFSPVAVYIHGGGFIGGTVEVVRNSCKLLAERSHSTVVSVDYSLAPEHRFPSGLTDCQKVIDYIIREEKTLGVDSSRLIVLGDSAGANLAAGCCLLDRERKIKLQVLLYPFMDVNPESPGWSEEPYCVRKNPEMARYLIHEIKDLLDLSTYSYINKRSEISNPLVSPLMAEDPSEFPTTLIVSPEYDYLRSQAEQFAHLLSENGVDVILYQYRGMGHAFFEHTGEFPQAEDCINEIAAAIMAL